MHDNICWLKFCLGIVSKDFTKNQQSGVSLNSTVYGFSIDHSSTEKENILNIHEFTLISLSIHEV